MSDCPSLLEITERDLGTVWESREEGWCFSATELRLTHHFYSRMSPLVFFQLSLPSHLQWACIVSQGKQHFISAQQNDRKPRMADRPQTRDDWEPTMNLWCCMFYFFSPWKEHCHLWKKKTIPCVCFRPQHSWTVKLSIPNLNLDLKFTSRREKTTFSQGNDGKVLVPVSPLLVSGSHAAPLPDLPQFESNHKRPIGCSGHVTYLGPKSTAFSDWSRIFPMGAAYRASAV